MPNKTYPAATPAQKEGFFDALRDGKQSLVEQSIALYGPDLLTWKDELGHTPLVAVVCNTAMREETMWDMAALLLKQGASVRDKFSGGFPLLFRSYLSREVYELLICHGAEIEARDPFGRTPLIGAALANLRILTDVLLEHKADINARDKEGYTPFMNAAKMLHLDVLKALHAAGADMQACDAEGNNALFLAAARNTTDRQEEEIVQFLMENGLDPEAPNAQGRTALDVAEQEDGNPLVAGIIRQHIADRKAREAAFLEGRVRHIRQNSARVVLKKKGMDNGGR